MNLKALEVLLATTPDRTIKAERKGLVTDCALLFQSRIDLSRPSANALCWLCLFHVIDQLLKLPYPLSKHIQYSR